MNTTQLDNVMYHDIDHGDSMVFIILEWCVTCCRENVRMFYNLATFLKQLFDIIDISYLLQNGVNCYYTKVDDIMVHCNDTING